MASTAPQNESSPDKSEEAFEHNEMVSSSNDPDYEDAADDGEFEAEENVGKPFKFYRWKIRSQKAKCLISA